MIPLAIDLKEADQPKRLEAALILMMMIPAT
jgi:hypothetical protein